MPALYCRVPRPGLLLTDRCGRRPIGVGAGNKNLPSLPEFDIAVTVWDPCSAQQGGFAGVVPGTAREMLVWPKGSSRLPCPQEVPAKFADDYKEACVVFPESAKSAAALGRRCLQNLLRDEAKVRPGNLADEIQQVIDSGKLPADLTDSIDAIRNIGNFAAHPLKSQQTGQILDVEAGEAEWILDVLESLFEFYFVRPAALQRCKAALNQKLQEAGKPPMK
jgi:hypothetical protein